MSKDIIIYPSGDTTNSNPFVRFSGGNDMNYIMEITDDGYVDLSVEENIVTSGLTLYLDAGNYDSYSGGTTWYDLTSNSNNTTLLNGPNYFDGSILFDGTDDDANINFPTLSTNGGSIELWATRENSVQNAFLFAKVGGSVNRFYIRQSMGTSEWDVVRGNPLSSAGLGTIQLSTFYQVVMTWDQSTVYAYKNGVLQNSNSYVNPNTDISDGQIAAGPGFNMNMKLNNFKIYNRKLSSTEVLQNYNAQKHRFGL